MHVLNSMMGQISLSREGDFAPNCKARFEWAYLPPVLGKVVVQGVGGGGSRILHIQSLNPMWMPTFFPVSCPVFVVRDLKLNKKKRRRRICTLNFFNYFKEHFVQY